MILGGLHLAGNDFRDRIPPTVNAFVQPEFNPDYIVPLHCTGFDAKVALRDKMGEKIVPGGVGLNVFVSAT
jgi:7,8-dihydropterin-6-yl-methyl-4-(beta-D-ribofuranosyl)aminobenzene 5'-phosphate synthase